MTRLAAAVALAIAGLAVPAAQAAPPELPCLEFYDPEHAESQFVCLDQVIDGFLPG